MKSLSLAMILAMSVVGWGQANNKADNAATWSAVNFENCREIGSTSNDPNPQDASVIYSCEGATVTLRGKWTQAVEYGTIYHETFGLPDAKTEPATEFDRDFFSWCRRDDMVIEMCGWNPNWKPNSKISMRPWYPNPKDYPAAEFSHSNTITLSEDSMREWEKCHTPFNGEWRCPYPDLASDPSIPIVTREPLSDPFPLIRREADNRFTEYCTSGHLEVWKRFYAETKSGMEQVDAHYISPEGRHANGLPDSDSDAGYPDKCVQDESDPTVPVVTREPLYKETKTCQKSYHLETWRFLGMRWIDSMSEGPIFGYAPLDWSGNDVDEKSINESIEHPDKCVQDKPPVLPLNNPVEDMTGKQFPSGDGCNTITCMDKDCKHPSSTLAYCFKNNSDFLTLPHKGIELPRSGADEGVTYSTGCISEDGKPCTPRNRALPDGESLNITGYCKGDCPPGGDRTTSADSKKCSDPLSGCDEGVRDFPVKPVSPKPQPKPCVDEEFNFNSDEGYTPVFMSCDANGDNCDTNSDRFDRVVVCKRFSSGESIDKAIRFCTDEEWKYMKPAIKMCKSNPPKPCPKVITGDMTVDCENVPKK